MYVIKKFQLIYNELLYIKHNFIKGDNLIDMHIKSFITKQDDPRSESLRD